MLEKISSIIAIIFLIFAAITHFLRIIFLFVKSENILSKTPPKYQLMLYYLLIVGIGICMAIYQMRNF